MVRHWRTQRSAERLTTAGLYYCRVANVRLLRLGVLFKQFARMRMTARSGED